MYLYASAYVVSVNRAEKLLLLLLVTVTEKVTVTINITVLRFSRIFEIETVRELFFLDKGKKISRKKELL